MVRILYDKKAEWLLEDIITSFRDNLLKESDLFINPNMLEDINDREIVYVLLTEDLSIISNHESRLKIINSSRSQYIATDKVQTSRLLIENGIPTPKTLISDKPEELIEFIDSLGGLAVLKYRYGCGGDNHYILRFENKEIYASVENKRYKINFSQNTNIRQGCLNLGPPFYAQEFISKDGNKNDVVYRTYVIGSKIPFGTERIKDNVEKAEDSIINVAKGARYEFMKEIPKEMLELSLNTAEAMGFDIGALDIISDQKGLFYVLEANLDCCSMFIDRKFKHHKNFCQEYDLDKYIIERLIEIEKGATFRK